jgi:hypothetical protein
MSKLPVFTVPTKILEHGYLGDQRVAWRGGSVAILALSKRSLLVCPQLRFCLQSSQVLAVMFETSQTHFIHRYLYGLSKKAINVVLAIRGLVHAFITTHKRATLTGLAFKTVYIRVCALLSSFVPVVSLDDDSQDESFGERFCSRRTAYRILIQDISVHNAKVLSKPINQSGINVISKICINLDAQDDRECCVDHDFGLQP